MKENLKAFLKAVQNNHCYENMTVPLNQDRLTWGFVCSAPFINISKSELTEISHAIASGKCLSGLIIDLTGNSSKNNGVIALLQCLKDPKRSPYISFKLEGNRIDNAGLIGIMEIIANGTNVPGLTLKLDGSEIRGNGYCTDKNSIDDQAMPKFAELLKQAIIKGNCHHLHINLNHLNIFDKGVTYVADAIDKALKHNPPPQRIWFIFPLMINEHLSTRIERSLENLAQEPKQQISYGIR